MIILKTQVALPRVGVGISLQPGFGAAVEVPNIARHLRHGQGDIKETLERSLRDSRLYPGRLPLVPIPSVADRLR